MLNCTVLALMGSSLSPGGRQSSKAEYAELLSLGHNREHVKGATLGMGLSVQRKFSEEEVHPDTLCECLAQSKDCL